MECSAALPAMATMTTPTNISGRCSDSSVPVSEPTRTSLATVVGLLPMAFKLETGSEAYAPLARAIIGGLISSILLTIFVVPAAYLLIYRRRVSSAGAPVAGEAH